MVTRGGGHLARDPIADDAGPCGGGGGETTYEGDLVYLLIGFLWCSWFFNGETTYEEGELMSFATCSVNATHLLTLIL